MVDAAIRHATAAAAAADDSLSSSSPLSLLFKTSVTNNEQPHRSGKEHNSPFLFPVVLDLGCGTGLVGRTLRSRTLSKEQQQQQAQELATPERAIVGALVCLSFIHSLLFAFLSHALKSV